MNVVERLNPRESHYLIDLLDFKAFWQKPFDEGHTFIGDFVTDKGKMLQIPQMYQLDYFSFIDTLDYKAISLPYSETQYRMLLVLPKNEKLAQFSEKMTCEKFTDILNSFTTEELILRLPRFRKEVNIQAESLLRKVIPTALDMMKADFSNIMDASMSLNEIKHKTRIEVNEQGTTAKSMTVESWMVLGLMPEFNADHPFLYFVYDDRTRAILLMGQFCGDGAIFRDTDK